MTNKKFPPRVLALLEEALRDKWQCKDGRELEKDLKAAIKWINSRAIPEGNVVVPGWMPIESAPKDGTFILVATSDGTWIARYCGIYPSGYRPENPWESMMLNRDHMPRYCSSFPTHWMPLPAAPAPEGEA